MACSTHGTDEKSIQSFHLEHTKGTEHLEDQGTDGRSMLKWFVNL
jgi:hypothetical protein